MKSTLPIFAFFIALVSCGQGSSESSTQVEDTVVEAKKETAKIEDFDCESFFDSGDYSSICFIDNKIPEYGGYGCIIDFVTKGDKQEQALKIQFTDKKETYLAEMHLNLNKSNYKKGEVIDVVKVGDDAFFDIYSDDLGSLSVSHKDLYVRNSNITFVLMADYQTNTEMPCFYSNSEMIDFANLIIENL